jgi:hypothetical protein
MRHNRNLVAKAYAAADAAYAALDLNPDTGQQPADRAYRAAYLAFRAAIDDRVKAPGRHWLND